MVGAGKFTVRVTVLRQCRAVIHLLVAAGRDGQCLLRHLQSAVHVGDVVAGRHILIAGVLDDRRTRHVVARAHHRLAARHRHTLNVVGAGKFTVRVTVLRQCRAVIHLLVAVGRDGQRLLRDFLREVVTHIVVTYAISGSKLCSNIGTRIVSIGIRICAGGCHHTCIQGRTILQSGSGSLCIVGHQSGTTVLLRVVNGDGEIPFRDAERTRLGRDRVVRVGSCGGRHKDGVIVHCLSRRTA